MVYRAYLATLAATFLVAPLQAHGGQYLPNPVVVPPGVPASGAITRPARPVPGVAPPPAAAQTGYRVLGARTSDWQTWWEFNHRPFLEARVVKDEEVAVSGSDDFYLGTRAQRQRFDMLKPTDKDLVERIVPALGRTLEKERNRDIVTACLVALGKIGRDAPGVELETVIKKYIPRDDQEVRETAVLSLGIAGRSKALPILASLLRDDAAGRKLEDRAKVKDRTRTFAAYGLGLLAQRSKKLSEKQEIHDLLLAVIEDDDIKDRDLGVACLSAMGLLGLEDQGAQKRLLWQTTAELFAFFVQDRGRGYEAVQAHAPIAIARLLGRGDSVLHQRTKGRLASVLTDSRKRSNPILRSAAIALGMLVDSKEKNPEDAQFSRVLQRVYDRGNDQNARRFALISLGRIGGASNREYLMKSYVRGNKSTERPWAAIALGILSFDRGTKGQPDAALAQILLEDLQDASDNSLRGALAIALGLTGYQSAAPSVMKLLRENENEQQSAGHLCISLALLGDRVATPQLSQILVRSMRRPFLVRHCAIALGQLGDRGASMELLRMVERSDSVAVLAALAVAIGRIGDRRSIDPLVQLLADKELTKLARGFVAAALGGIGDKDVLPFNAPLTVDCNYTSSVATLTNGATGVLDIL